MAVENTYNPNPSTVDSLLRQRQTRVDLGRQSGEIPEATPVAPAPKPFAPLGVEQTPDYEDKSFGRKVGEDAAMLAYAVPVGLAKVATGLLTHPIDTAKELGSAFVGSVKDAVNPDYYKAHPLLGVVNLAGFITPVAGVAKSLAIKTAMKTALETGIKEAVLLGMDESAARVALTTGMKEAGGLLVNKGSFGTAVWEAAKTGKVEIVSEVAKNLLSKAGVADDVALRVSSEISNNLYTTLSRQTTKLKTLESLAHPVGTAIQKVTNKVDPIRKAIFGSPAETAVGRIYGADAIKADPQGFVDIERWAAAQVRERGFEDTVANRQRMMMEWVDQNSEWASLTPEERVLHFRNYAKSDLTRLALHEATGIDMVTVKALPQNYVDAMVATIKESPEKLGLPELMKVMEDAYGRDFTNHLAEISRATSKTATREALIEAVSKLGDKRSAISFTKFSPEVQKLAAQLETTGYRIGRAPTSKPVSQVTDVLKGGAKGIPAEEIGNVLTKRTSFGQWFDKLGFSPNGLVEGAVEYSYRENFTQRAINNLGTKFGNVIKADKISIPVEKVFEWLDNNRERISQLRPKFDRWLPIRTVFEITVDDLKRAGFAPEIAAEIAAISKQSLRDIPVSLTGMGDAVVNYMRTSNKGFGKWYSDWYEKYLQFAYKGRYDWSPFFGAQQFLETQINSALLLKDAKAFIPGGKTLTLLGDWTAEKLGKKLLETKKYLKDVIEEPPIEEIAMVKNEVLGSLQKTMLEATTPDLMQIRNTALGNLKDKAAFNDAIRSKNVFYQIIGQSNVKLATTFNKAIAHKFGMNLEDALKYTFEDGVKKYSNPQMVQMMRELTQAAYHYQPGVLTSPLMKTLNIVWFPMRFQAKTVQLASRWLNSLSPASRMVMMNNWAHFANWAGTDEGIEWRRTNRNYLYNILAYTTAYEQMGTATEAVTKGRLFGGNAGLIGGVPFGFFVNLARELAILPEDPDQFDAKTGRRFTKEVPRDVVSVAALSVALEQLIISVSPSTPFYSLTGGAISGISPRKQIESLSRQILGNAREAAEGRDATKGKQRLERDFKRVPLDYTRLAQ